MTDTKVVKKPKLTEVLKGWSDLKEYKKNLLIELGVKNEDDTYAISEIFHDDVIMLSAIALSYFNQNISFQTAAVKIKRDLEFNEI